MDREATIRSFGLADPDKSVGVTRFDLSRERTAYSSQNQPLVVEE
jgi:hypothetical protein